jgi:methylated-DNA-[protein]-cysteine S-methyltransferase
MDLEYRIIKSPLGDITLVADRQALRVVAWGEHLERLTGDLTALRRSDDNPILERTREQLEQYFASERREFDVPLAPQGTAFQRQVWEELCRIPYGATLSYGEQAARLGRPNASRAVGAANGRNPIAILIPCHRVVSGLGRLTGYAGGLDAKQSLLELEARGKAGQQTLFSQVGVPGEDQTGVCLPSSALL